MEELVIRIDRRRIVASIVVSAAAVQIAFAAIAFVARGSTESDLAAARDRHDDLVERIELAESERVATASAHSDRWQLADAPDVSATLRLVQELGDAAAVELTSLAATKSTTEGRQSFRITGTASPAAVCTFLRSVEQSDRLVVVESGRVLPGSETAVIFDLDLATYHALRSEGRR